MSKTQSRAQIQSPIAGSGWQAFKQLVPERLGLGPHAIQIFNELTVAAKSGQPVTTILLAATLADVALYEGASYQFDDDEMAGMGIDWLSAGERRRLDGLRARRNALVHHEGPVDGLMDQAGDADLLATDADKALAAVVPLLEGLEQF